METSYKAKGIVLGKYWGGGSGSYAATPLVGFTSRKDLLKKAKEKLQDGSLDSGMGYESLIGALLIVTTVREVELDGRRFTNEETYTTFVGKLNQKQKDFLWSIDF